MKPLTARKERLAEIHAVLLTRLFLKENRLTFRTNHEANKWLLRMLGASEKSTRWHPRFLRLYFYITHHAEIEQKLRIHLLTAVG